MTKPLRVVVLSRHELTRAGLTRLIEIDPGRAQVVRPCETDRPLADCDALVYDLAGQGGTRDDDLRHLVATRIAVVALRPEASPDVAEKVLAMGVADVVSMNVTAAGLLASIEASAAGRRVPPTAVRSRARASSRGATGLTERELAVLELIAAGLSNDQVAANLYVSINSVKSYIRTAYKRIGVTSRSQAVIWAIGHGLGPVAEAGSASPPVPGQPPSGVRT